VQQNRDYVNKARGILSSHLMSLVHKKIVCDEYYMYTRNTEMLQINTFRLQEKSLVSMEEN